jgi:predicted ribonuclease toxin of YeeF-YezG toxin-antitoxin module
MRDKVFEDNRNPETGHVLDPLTEEIIDKDEPWHMGHKPGYEFRKHAASARARGITRKQFLNEHNDPSHYWPELPDSNCSHAGELLTDDYFGP